MSKLLIAGLILLFTSFQSHSQVIMTLIFGDKLNSDGLEFGLEGGGNFAKLGGLESNTYFKDWNLGFYFDIRIKENSPWYLYTGTLVKARLGTGNLTSNDVNILKGTIYNEDGNYEQKINYFLVPVLAKYKFNECWYVEGGTQLGLMYNAWVEYTSNVDGKDAIVKDFNEELFTRIDAGLMGGFGYRMKGRTGWTFGFKYYYGLTNVIKNIDGSKNQSYFLKVNIPIGRSECAQEKKRKKAEKKKNRKEKKQNS